MLLPGIEEWADGAATGEAEDMALALFLCDLRKARGVAQQIMQEAPRAINHRLGVELQSFAPPFMEVAMKSQSYLQV